MICDVPESITSSSSSIAIAFDVLEPVSMVVVQLPDGAVDV